MEEIYKLKKIIDKEINKEINNLTNPYTNHLLESMHYSLSNGGKRIRPILALKVYEMFIKNFIDYKDILPYSIAIEFIHTYSLIHDDLPAMDNDDYRRGEPTNHIKFGEDIAILAGDALLNLAFEVIVNANTNISETQTIDILKVISYYSGINGMIGGQTVDINLNPENISKDKIMYMYDNKTAALIKAPIIIGGIVSGVDKVCLNKLKKFGYNLGMAYQIKDDFLDLEEDSLINKQTYISLFGEEKSRLHLKEFTDNALAILEDFSELDNSFLISLTQKLRSRKL